MARTIFLLTVLDREAHKRTWGWYPSLDTAEKDIFAHNNDLLFESGTYVYAVIEEVTEGFMGGLVRSRQWWYQAERLEHLSDDPTDYGWRNLGSYWIAQLKEAPEAFVGAADFWMC